MVTKSASIGKPAKQSKASLTRSGELAQSLMRSARTGMHIVQDGKFVYVSPLFQELSGCTEEQLVGLIP